ncbi:hypothetical protein LCGC14_0371000 [marine sediment metagenome]|uniref:3D domain-containing protein n=1 Tax=marine sediment metagenome TaxID=412755 RepID=A0A0F9TB75_9ZZZZ|nr:hypothetical protein [Maribacter sp.]HDZ04859.1 hypothetical protein [Maribacter sp.]
MKSKLDIFNRRLITGIIIVLMITAVTSGVLLQPEYGNHNRQPLTAGVDNGRESLKVKPSPIYVHATIYHATVAQTDSTPFVTASGFKINRRHPEKHRICGVSPDLLKPKGPFEYGDTIRVKKCEMIYNGLWIIQDKMNKRHTNSIDFLVGKGMIWVSMDSVIIELFKV